MSATPRDRDETPRSLPTRHLFHLVMNGPCVAAASTLSVATTGRTSETEHPLANPGACPFCDAARVLLAAPAPAEPAVTL